MQVSKDMSIRENPRDFGPSIFSRRKISTINATLSYADFFVTYNNLKALFMNSHAYFYFKNAIYWT